MLPSCICCSTDTKFIPFFYSGYSHRLSPPPRNHAVLPPQLHRSPHVSHTALHHRPATLVTPSFITAFLCYSHCPPLPPSYVIHTILHHRPSKLSTPPSHVIHTVLHHRPHVIHTTLHQRLPTLFTPPSIIAKARYIYRNAMQASHSNLTDLPRSSHRFPSPPRNASNTIHFSHFNFNALPPELSS